MMKSLMLLKNILLIQIIWPLSREKFLVWDKVPHQLPVMSRFLGVLSIS
jgi:hypothetical protein